MRRDDSEAKAAFRAAASAFAGKSRRDMLNLSNRYGEETRMNCGFLSRVSEKVSQTAEPF
jgi:hypothetical protein